MADDVTLQARISELPAATKTNDTDLFEVSQGSPPVSRRMSMEMIKAGVKPDLSGFLTGIVGGDGIVVGGRAPVVTVSLETLVGSEGVWGDGLNIPEVTVDAHGRVINVSLVPITPTDLSGYAPIDSPAFTGQPTAPLAPLADSTARLATTQWTLREITAQGYAPLDSPDFVGTPTAPTAPQDTNTQQLANCAFVQQAIALGASITVGATPPAAPRPNQLWWHSVFGQMFIYYNDGDTSQWVPASPAMSTVSIPPGSGQDYFGGTVPAGWYLCDGSLKSRTTDAPLFAAIGTTYGAGDGSTTFALPDCRGRVLAMRDYATGRLTSIADSVGASGGADSIALSVAQLPSHTHAGPLHAHTVGAHGHTARGAGIVGNNLANGTSRAVGTGDGVNSGYFQDISVTVDNAGAMGTDQQGSGPTSATGSGTAHPNVQPTMAVNKLIKR